MGKKKNQKNIQSKLAYRHNQEEPFYPTRKVMTHIVERTKKRTNSLVRMKPLKKRQNNLGLPEFCPKGYTQQQFDLYKEEYSRIFQLNRDDLREILKLNKQDITPITKIELLHRCADGYALGRIPICPHCFGTTPVYDKNKANYFCPGYKQVEQFVSCESNFDKQDLPRIKPWNTNFEERQRIKIQRTEDKLRKQKEYQYTYKINKRQKQNKKRQQEEQQKPQSEGENYSEQIVLQKQERKEQVKKESYQASNQMKPSLTMVENSLYIKDQNI